MRSDIPVLILALVVSGTCQIDAGTALVRTAALATKPIPIPTAVSTEPYTGPIALPDYMSATTLIYSKRDLKAPVTVTQMIILPQVIPLATSSSTSSSLPGSFPTAPSNVAANQPKDHKTSKILVPIAIFTGIIILVGASIAVWKALTRRRREQAARKAEARRKPTVKSSVVEYFAPSEYYSTTPPIAMEPVVARAPTIVVHAPTAPVKAQPGLPTIQESSSEVPGE
jgi:hypothetical protein